MSAPDPDLLSLNAATVRERWTLRDIITGCARHQIRGIAPWRDQVQQLGLKDTARRIRDAGLTVTGYCRGGMFPAPHGAVCAALLPVVMEVNLRALRERKPGSLLVQRFDEIGRILCREPATGGPEGVAWIRSLCSALGIPGLRAYGLGVSDLPGLVSKARVASESSTR